MSEMSMTPAHASIRRHLMVGGIALVLLFGGIGGWLVLTELSSAVIGSGLLVVETNVKKVQHPTGGVVGELKVKEGESVKQGQVLVRLDDTQSKANLAIVTKALDELAARQARNEAERDGAGRIEFAAELLARLDDPDVSHVVTGERRLFEIRKSSREGQKAQLREQIVQLEQQIRGSREQEAAKAKEVDWIQQELKGIRELWRQNLIPFNRVTALERDAARLEGERAALTAAIAQAKGRVAETELKILQIDEDLRTEVGKELADIRGKKSEYVERRVAAEDQLKRTDLVAPQDGKVFQRNVSTVGGVIQPGETVMSIVPDQDFLVIDTKIPPQSIDRVSVGQTAVVRFNALNQRTTPELIGEVIRIGADVVQDERKNEVYYSVRVIVPETELKRLGNVKLVAGMPVEVFIQAESRSALSYLVKPIEDQIARAFREK